MMAARVLSRAQLSGMRHLILSGLLLAGCAGGRPGVIEVQPQGGQAAVLQVDGATRISEDGQPVGTGELVEGSEVRAAYDGTRVQRLEVKRRPERELRRTRKLEAAPGDQGMPDDAGASQPEPLDPYLTGP